MIFYMQIIKNHPIKVGISTCINPWGPNEMSRSNNPSPFFTTKIDRRMYNETKHEGQNARSWNENIWLFSNLLIPNILVAIIWPPFHCPWDKLQQLLFLLQKSQTKYKNDLQRNLFDYFKEIFYILNTKTLFKSMFDYIQKPSISRR
jgi:hypothetical protein